MWDSGFVKKRRKQLQTPILPNAYKKSLIKRVFFANFFLPFVVFHVGTEFGFVVAAFVLCCLDMKFSSIQQAKIIWILFENQRNDSRNSLLCCVFEFVFFVVFLFSWIFLVVWIWLGQILLKDGKLWNYPKTKICLFHWHAIDAGILLSENTSVQHQIWTATFFSNETLATFLVSISAVIMGAKFNFWTTKIIKTKVIEKKPLKVRNFQSATVSVSTFPRFLRNFSDYLIFIRLARISNCFFQIFII